MPIHSTMDIYSLPGSLVRFTNLDAGYKGDQERAAKYLELNKTYRVDEIHVGSFSTRVYLVGIPGVNFNSVLFINVY